MTVGRPELVETIVAWSGLSPSYVENSTRRQMEAGQLDKIKGRRTAKRRSYGPKEGSTALIGMPGGGDAPEVFKKLSILEAAAASGGIVVDPVARLLPPLKVPTFDENEISRIELHPFLSAVLGGISRLSVDDASALCRAPEAKSACLELNVEAETAVFRWSADDKEHWVRFEHPRGTIAEVLGQEPPAYQTVAKLYFPLLYAVGRLFAAAPAHDSVDPVPSSGEATASADPEKGNAARPGAALPGDRSRNSRTRSHPRAKVRGGGEILKPVLLSLDRLPFATPSREVRPHGLARRPDPHRADSR